MYRLLLTVASLLLLPSAQHFVMPPTWCQLATVCNHTGIPECAQLSNQQNNSNFKMFLDECDMYEYNCDNLKEYIKVEVVNCPNISTTLSETNESVTLATPLTITTVTTPNNPPFATIHNSTSKSSATTAAEVTELEKNRLTPQLDVSLLTTGSTCTRNRNLTTSLQSTIPTTKNCTRNKNQPPTIQNEATTEIHSSTTPSSVTNVSAFTLLETTMNINQLDSTTKQECTRNKNTSSSTATATKTTVITSIFPSSTPPSTLSTAISDTLSTQLITPSNNTTMHCTRNSKQNLTSESQTSTPLLTTPFTSTTTTKPSLILSSSTSHDYSSITKVNKSTILETNTSTQEIYGSIGTECTRHTKLTSPITSTIVTKSSLSPTESTSTKNVSENTSLKTLYANQTEPITEKKINCTRNHTLFTPLSTIQVTESMTSTSVSNSTNIHETIIVTTVEYEEDDRNERNKKSGDDDGKQTDVTLNVMQPTLIECEKYPKTCRRPSTWETTAQGEIRDFFQILRAKFGTRVRLLRATTHWPVRAPFFINDGTFMFGRHNDS